jgi:hypothetical protein
MLPRYRLRTFQKVHGWSREDEDVSPTIKQILEKEDIDVAAIVAARIRSAEFRSPPRDVRSSAGPCRIARGLGPHTGSATQIRLRGRGHAVAGGRVTDRSGSGYRYGSIWTRLS